MILRLFTMLIAMLCIAPRIARADSEPIALLPLDADGRLEIYGQPIAAEIARALTDGKLTVVVVEAKMAVPDGTKLVVAGSITAKGTAVVLGVQVRNPADGTVTDKLEEPAANVAAIGKAAAKLAERLAPVVKARLEVLRKVVVPDRKPPPDVRPQAQPVVLLGVGVSMNASLIVEPFRQALIDNVNRTLRANQRQPSPVDASTLGAQLAVQTVATARASRGIVFEILDYAIEPGMIPLVRARVRVRIADGTRVQFDETLATDTIVGDKLSPPGVLAFRTAREIMTILRPHLRKLEPRWR